mgnify:CR=1 FL=1
MIIVFKPNNSAFWQRKMGRVYVLQLYTHRKKRNYYNDKRNYSMVLRSRMMMINRSSLNPDELKKAFLLFSSENKILNEVFAKFFFLLIEKKFGFTLARHTYSHDTVDVKVLAMHL